MNEEYAFQKKLCDNYQKAAESGDLIYGNKLALCFLTGQGRGQNIDKAQSILIDLIKDGHQESKLDLASLYLVNKPSEINKAISLLEDILGMQSLNGKPEFVLASTFRNVDKLRYQTLLYHAANSNHKTATLVITYGVCMGAFDISLNPEICGEWFELFKSDFGLNHFYELTEFNNLIIDDNYLRALIISDDDIRFIKNNLDLLRGFFKG